jgi:aspartyl-tRNA(Asn)/glutamyl-tRNA(Gln) amidotransferase subunit A
MAARLRVGVARNYFFDNLAPDVAGAVDGAIRWFHQAKSEVRDVTFPIDVKTMSRVFDPIVVAEIHERYGREWKRRPQMFSEAFGSFFQARVPSGLELAAAHRALLEFQQRVRELFEQVDVILTPTVPITAPRIEGPISGALILRNTWPLNAARTPAISVLCGFDRAGLPIGLQLIAAPFDEDTLLGAASTLELSLSERKRPML